MREGQKSKLKSLANLDFVTRSVAGERGETVTTILPELEIFGNPLLVALRGIDSVENIGECEERALLEMQTLAGMEHLVEAINDFFRQRSWGEPKESDQFSIVFSGGGGTRAKIEKNKDKRQNHVYSKEKLFISI